MNDFKPSMIKYTKTFSLLYCFISLIANIVKAIAIPSGASDVITALPSFLQSVAVIVITAILYKNLVKGCDQKTSLKLLPFALVPYALMSLVFKLLNAVLSTVISLTSIEYDHTEEITHAVCVITAMIIVIGFSDKYIGRYGEIFTQKGTLVFPKEYGLKNKWWFALAANIISDVISGIAASVIPFVTDHDEFIDPIQTVLNTVVWIFAAILLFKAVFKTIDRETRILFYPLIIVFSACSQLTGALLSPVTSGAYSGLLKSTIDVGNISSIMVGMTIIFVSAVISVVLGILISSKALKAYEE